jgi:hypothetical protein
MKTRLPGFSYDRRGKVAEFRVIVPKSGAKTRRRLTVRAETRDEALSKWKAFRDQVRDGRNEQEPLPFSVHVERVWPLLRARLSKRNGDEETRILDQFPKPFFGEKRIDRINRALAQDFIAGMERKGYSPDYICRIWRLVSKILHDAVDREAIPAYPIRGKVALPKAAKLKLEMTPKEQAAFLTAFDDEAAFRAAFASGWKSGESRDESALQGPASLRRAWEGGRDRGGDLLSGVPLDEALLRRGDPHWARS